MRYLSDERIQAMDVYLKITRWAKNRYSKNGEIILYHAGGRPSIYSRIEAAAWSKYICVDLIIKEAAIEA